MSSFSPGLGGRRDGQDSAGNQEGKRRGRLISSPALPFQKQLGLCRCCPCRDTYLVKPRGNPLDRLLHTLVLGTRVKKGHDLVAVPHYVPGDEQRRMHGAAVPVSAAGTQREGLQKDGRAGKGCC